MNARETLNELKWRNDRCLERAVIYLTHRGAPKDTKIISGRGITSLGNSFFETPDSTIPYHRIFRIEYDGHTIFKRP